MSLCDLESAGLNLPDRLTLERIPLINQPVDPPFFLVDHAEDQLHLVGWHWFRCSAVIVGDRSRICFRLQLGDVQQPARDPIVQLSDEFKIAPVHECDPPDHPRHVQ